MSVAESADCVLATGDRGRDFMLIAVTPVCAFVVVSVLAGWWNCGMVGVVGVP